jgi:hypothetical protein
MFCGPPRARVCHAAARQPLRDIAGKRSSPVR